MTTPESPPLPLLILQPTDLDALSTAWEEHRRRSPVLVPPLTRALHLPRRAVVEGRRYLVAEPFRLLVRSYSSAVIYGDGRISADYMALPLEERDTAPLLSMNHVMPAVPTFGADYTDNVRAAGGVTPSIRFHPAAKMPAWAARWEIEVLTVRNHSLFAAVTERIRTVKSQEWNRHEVRRVLRLEATIRAAYRSGRIDLWVRALGQVYRDPRTDGAKHVTCRAQRNVICQHLVRLPAEKGVAVLAAFRLDLFHRRSGGRRHGETRRHVDHLFETLRTAYAVSLERSSTSGGAA